MKRHAVAARRLWSRKFPDAWSFPKTFGYRHRTKGNAHSAAFSGLQKHDENEKQHEKT